MNHRHLTSPLWLSIALICTAYNFLFCSTAHSPVAAGGSGTGVGNGAVVTGMVVYADSTPVAHATVRLRPQNFVADTSGQQAISGKGVVSSSTDIRGVFTLNSLDTSEAYTLEIDDNRLQAQGTLYRFTAEKPDTIKLPTRILQPMPDLVGTVVGGFPASSYIQLFGLERVGKTDTHGQFLIEELPIGECEHNECEYKFRALIPQEDGSWDTRIGEFEIETHNDSIIEIEVELHS